MFGNRRLSATTIGCGLALAAIAAGAGPATSTDGPVRCSIEVTEAGAGIALESQVISDVAVSGSYRFRVQGAGSSGSANLQQGGAFTAGPGGPVTLGRIMLGDARTLYDATLEIEADGASVTCSKRVGGKI